MASSEEDLGDVIIISSRQSNYVKEIQDASSVTILEPVFCDNFYTSIELTVKLRGITDDEIALCGTVRLNNIDTEDKNRIKMQSQS